MHFSYLLFILEILPSFVQEVLSKIIFLKPAINVIILKILFQMSLYIGILTIIQAKSLFRNIKGELRKCLHCYNSKRIKLKNSCPKPCIDRHWNLLTILIQHIDLYSYVISPWRWCVPSCLFLKQNCHQTLMFS